MKNGVENISVVDNGAYRVNTPRRCFIQVKTQSAKAMPASLGCCEPFFYYETLTTKSPSGLMARHHTSA